MNYYNCEASVTTTATFQLEFYQDNFTMWAYSLVHNEQYASIIASGNAISALKVIGKDESHVIREFRFDAPLRQTISHYHHGLKTFRQDAVYMLLSNNKILRFKKTELENIRLSNFNLTKHIVYETNTSNIIAFDAKLGKIALIDVSDNLIILDEID